MGELTRQFTGRVVVPGTGHGPALVTTEPLSFWGGLDPATGEIIDRRHPLSDRILTGRVLVLPRGRGSCSASGVLLEAIRNRTAPAAILTTSVDPIIALGAVLGDELYGLPLPVVYLLTADAAVIRDGDLVDVDGVGTVKVVPSSSRRDG